jgi:hypothetical protein
MQIDFLMGLRLSQWPERAAFVPLLGVCGPRFRSIVSIAAFWLFHMLNRLTLSPSYQLIDKSTNLEQNVSLYADLSCMKHKNLRKIPLHTYPLSLYIYSSAVSAREPRLCFAAKGNAP